MFRSKTSLMLPNHLIPPIRLPGTAVVDDTSLFSFSIGPFPERGNEFTQTKTPSLPFAIPNGIGRNAPIAGQLQHSPTGDTKELRASLSVHEWLNLRHTTLLGNCVLITCDSASIHGSRS